jgi:hypothetical protein
MLETTNDILVRFWANFVSYLPIFFGGFIILIVGFFVAALLKKILLTLLAFFRVDALLNKTGLITQKEVRIWQEVLTELVKWTIIILFLIPTLETWGLSRATVVLNQFLFYLPNVIVAVVIGFVGIVVSNLTADLVRHSIKSSGATSALTLSAFAKSTIVFFTILIMMNQLGVAQDLIRIFFTGIVAALAIAAGLAFGLGGRDTAKRILDDIMNKLGKG